MKTKFLFGRGKKAACLGITALMAFSFAFQEVDFSSAEDGGTEVTATVSSSSSGDYSISYSNVTGSVDTSSVQFSNFSSSVMTSSSSSSSTYEERTVIVTLEGESILEAKGDDDTAADYLSTSTGRKTQRNIESAQDSFLSTLSGLGIDYELEYSYYTVANAVAITINTSYVSRIKNIEGVESVVISETYAEPEVEESTSSSSAVTVNDTSVYSTGIYNSSEFLEEYGGKGMTVAILDTGLDYTHEAFQTMPSDLSAVALTEQEVEDLLASKDFNASGDVYINAKIPFAYDYADKDDDVYPSYSNHGTHVAGIIAGRADSYTDKDGNIAVTTDEEGNTVYEEFVGVAPEAQLVICKVFTDDLDSSDIGGARTEDILAALQDCVLLGVDVINMSLGNTCGFSSTNDGDDEGKLMQTVYDSVEAAGISLIAAASNDYSSSYGGTYGTNLTSNPDSGTVGSPSTYSGAISVASISGKQSPYLLANAIDDDPDNDYSVFYQESSDENSVDYDFAAQMLVDEEGNTVSQKIIYYVVIPGVGLASDYTSAIRNSISSLHSQGYTVAALIQRGNNTFQEKVEIAMQYGVDAVIIYNNVAGEIKMTIGDVEDPVPTISITQEAGENLRSNATSRVGTLTINSDYYAGPFMSSFSSWGTTSDLKLKPEITAHGGEITSSVPGGWAEMSGTSMATPNVAGLVANVRSYLASVYPGYSAQQITQLTNQLMMSTATIVRDEDGLAYSPRKQGAGLASLSNIINTNAYLWTDSGATYTSAHGTYTGAEDNRPKIELGDDPDKVGEYTLNFWFTNTSSSSMKFTLNSYFMTESLSYDGLAVGEQAYMLSSNAVWEINNKTYSDGETVELSSGPTQIKVTLSLSDEDREYLDSNFENGIYVEGFLQLLTQDTSVQCCDLSLPFLGFYGDWESAPMLDYDAFEISAIEQDTSIADDEKAQASVWATQAYSMYWNDEYVLPLGSFLYTQDEDADQIYTTEEYCAVSRYNDYTGEDENNYMTSTAIKGLYAGTLRNAKVVKCYLTSVATGELIYEKEVYRVNKAYTSGGSTTPGYIKLEISPEELGLLENGQYNLKFVFYFNEDSEPDEDDTFEFNFYIDYTAPVLEDASIRYVDYKDENGNAQQRVYLDLSIYDNHYAMAALLCRMTTNSSGENVLELATDYVTPVYNATKNGTSTVSIEITDLISEYGASLYVELDDYALNHTIYQIDITSCNETQLPSSFSLADGESTIALTQYETHTVSLNWDTTTYPNANLSNFTWTVKSSSSKIIAVKNGEIVGLSPGTGTLTVTNGKQTYTITVTVTESSKTLSKPSISFGTILNKAKVPTKASGTVEVNIEQEIQLEIETDPWWYLLVNDLDIVWASTNESVATVDDNGNVTLLKKGTTRITATISGTAYTAYVTLSVQEPFTVSSYSLTDYTGTDEVVYIPTDMNIMYIGEEAFKDNEYVTTIIIPKTVTAIYKKAFYNCPNLKYIFFVDVTTQEIADCDLTLIYSQAFYNCPSLEIVDFSNCKTFTIAREAFYGCTGLKLIKGFENIGTAYDYAFYDCTSLAGSLSSGRDAGEVSSVLVDTDSITYDKDGYITGVTVLDADDIISTYGVDTLDLSDLHVSGNYVFRGCTSITNIKTDEFTAIGYGMFYGCSGLEEITIETAAIGAYAFYNCDQLYKVTIKGVDGVTIGNYAFAECGNLTYVTFDNSTVTSIGDYAFAGTYIKSFEIPQGLTKLGANIFNGNSRLTSVYFDCDFSQITLSGAAFKNVTVTVSDTYCYTDENGVIYTLDKTTLLWAPASLTSLNILDTVTAIAPYALAYTNITSLQIPASVVTIGEGALYGSSVAEITFGGTDLKTIAAYAFAGTRLASVSLPSSVTYVGDGAFESTPITAFDYNPAENAAFGNNVFADCTSLVNITLGDKITTMGNYTFYGCTALKTVDMPSVTSLGIGTFYGATALTAVTFGDDATTVGSYTFYTYTYSYDSSSSAWTVSYDRYANLATVTLGDKITTIGEYAFVYCTSLTSINLGAAQEVAEGAFYGCSSLSTVTGIENLIYINDYAFCECASLTELNLTSAQTIGDYAFAVSSGAAYTTINIPAAKEIGDFAFMGNSATEVTIPKTLTATQKTTVSGGTLTYSAIGEGAFSNSSTLTSFKVDEDNTDYFVDGGVLYRYIDGDTYELVAYPSALAAANGYTVLTGTVSIKSYAFAYLTADVASVTIPYSVTIIGTGAFYDSGIATYNFLGDEAPTLGAEYNREDDGYINTGSNYYRGLFNTNFQAEIIYNTELYTGSDVSSVSLTMTYPTNGTGYDNYVYTAYFATRTQSGYVLNSTSRTIKSNIESFYSLETISGWLSDSFTVNDENTAVVEEFSELVKETHRLYNNISSDENQVALLTEELISKLTDTESVLADVKEKFNIATTISRVSYDSDSYKADYSEGDYFDITGLVVIVTYDDYSQASISGSALELDSKYNRELTIYDLYVVVNCTELGKTVRVLVNVTEAVEEDNTGDNTDDNTGDGSGTTDGDTSGGTASESKSGCGAISFGDTAGLGGAAALMCIACLFVIKRFRRIGYEK